MTGVRTLGIYLEPTPRAALRIGTLLTDGSVTRFFFDESYLELGPARPILSAAFHAPHDEAHTLRRLQDPSTKVSRGVHVPSYFAHLLPEGALRDLVKSQLETALRDEFAMLERLGTDLPGAVVARAESFDAGRPAPTAPAETERPRTAAVPRLKFSLAGVQLKFSLVRRGDTLVMPASGGGGHVIAKLASHDWPFLCEAELLGMRLAEAAGARVAQCALVSADAVEGIRRELIPGAWVLAVERFDRRGTGRIHMEEFASVLGLPAGDAKYSQNIETLVRLIWRFSSSPREDVLEAVRRIVIDILIGNGDSHLKNWAFTYGVDGKTPRLSPAYDMVPTVLFIEGDELALKFGGKRAFRAVTRRTLAALTRWVEIPEAEILDEVDQVLERASSAWAAIVRDVPLPPELGAKLEKRWRDLGLTRHLPNAFLAEGAERAELVSDEGESIPVNGIRGRRPNPRREPSMTFSIPPNVRIDAGQRYRLCYDGRPPLPLSIRSVRSSKGHTLVVARVLDDEARAPTPA